MFLVFLQTMLTQEGKLNPEEKHFESQMKILSTVLQSGTVWTRTKAVQPQSREFVCLGYGTSLSTSPRCMQFEKKYLFRVLQQGCVGLTPGAMSLPALILYSFTDYILCALRQSCLPLLSLIPNRKLKGVLGPITTHGAAASAPNKKKQKRPAETLLLQDGLFASIKIKHSLKVSGKSDFNCWTNVSVLVSAALLYYRVCGFLPSTRYNQLPTLRFPPFSLHFSWNSISKHETNPR